MAAVFAWLQNLTQAFQHIIVYHVHETTVIVFWAYVSCQCVNSCAIQLKPPKRKTQSSRSLFVKWGNGGDTSPTAALSPPSERFGGVTGPSATQPDQLPPSWRFLRQWQPLLTKHQQGYFDWGPARSKPEGQTLLQCQRSRPSDDHCLHWQTNFWGKFREQPRCLWTAPHGADWSSSANTWRLQGLPSFQEGQLLPRHVDDYSAKTTVGRDVEGRIHMRSISDCDALILWVVFLWSSWEMSERHFSVSSDRTLIRQDFQESLELSAEHLGARKLEPFRALLLFFPFPLVWLSICTSWSKFKKNCSLAEVAAFGAEVLPSAIGGRQLLLGSKLWAKSGPVAIGLGHFAWMCFAFLTWRETLYAAMTS